MPTIRAYRGPDDDAALTRICLLTADVGRDATGLLVHDELWADVYALPYAHHDPTLTFLAESGGERVGYVLATADTTTFERWFASEWWPGRAGRYHGLPDGDARVSAEQERERSLLTTAERVGGEPAPWVREYPAHLHIDLLPSVQGRGLGRRLIEHVTDALRQRGVPGVHLVAGAGNAPALAFYPRVGFTELERTPGAVAFGMRLSRG